MKKNIKQGTFLIGFKGTEQVMIYSLFIYCRQFNKIYLIDKLFKQHPLNSIKYVGSYRK